ncbi:MAG: hypothetical protein EOR67_21625 [Mesorhizobium sp.]|uniref:hypothetical protein n=1 Tax=Mesorhizobium sp. TaxID=1871066 RepID=UPI000FE622D2|nr:hypothetical protein [Mesorhizobium sp.]RWL85672.1 MAG: hypothetical protein EOR67_21625 [Mesorhizobium sp.]
MTDKDDFRESFLRANANLDFISYQFADVVRNLMRAAASSDPSSAVYKAAEKMNFVADLLSRTEEKFGFYHVFEKAITELTDSTEQERGVETAIVAAAKDGMKFLVERSCDDNAARGRTSRRRQEFLSSIRWIEEERESNRRAWKDRK